MNRVKNELKEFKNFKQSFVFKQLELEQINEETVCNGVIVKDKNLKITGESDFFVNSGYNIKNPYSKVLSNLFPYEFVFKGKKVKSIESVFQALKFKNKKQQNLIFKYFGTDSNNIKAITDYDWTQSGEVYWQGNVIDRFSKEYEDFIDELYISAIQNSLYRTALKKNTKYILHSIGVTDSHKTLFTRYEFEREMNCLSQFLKGRK